MQSLRLWARDVFLIAYLVSQMSPAFSLFGQNPLLSLSLSPDIRGEVIVEITLWFVLTNKWFPKCGLQ